MTIEVTGTEYIGWFGPDRWGEEQEPTHFFDRVTMAYTACWLLASGQLAVPHTANKKQVTCPKCLENLRKGGENNMTRLQVGANFTVIGSKANTDEVNKALMAGLPGGLILEIKTLDGRSVGMLTASPKQYKSGSVGFYANGKITL